jgi:hypothetical protein
MRKGQVMDAIEIPSRLPATIVRPRDLTKGVMIASLREQGPNSRTASAWQWVLTGHGAVPISQVGSAGCLPGADDITAEVRHDPAEECGWPPWRTDLDVDRRQARRVLRWLTGAADALPLLDPNCGQYVGARFNFARTDEEIGRVRDWAWHGLLQHGDLPEHMSAWQAEHPWQWPAEWMNAAWLRGTIAYLDWILGDSQEAPITFKVAQAAPPGILAAAYARLPTPDDIAAELELLSAVLMQGHEGQPGPEPECYPPPQWGEGVQQAHDWLIGEDTKPPVDHHGCGSYYACPGGRRCSCEAAGYCLRSRCPACTDQVCNAAWTTIESSY